ncbi:hypothetical protein [Brasilonema sp. UFV-L1]|uniref:hypothetical protein n=1 Tax=Brasilonema sp. UFV-L1 TaxID=2234130 RepID=UPI00145F0539|nr:hypothetical protein [Brasilonema sp. UFV-L1]NMG08309.1 hypothetical protein [Brasilonema sp. UFV-L1]
MLNGVSIFLSNVTVVDHAFIDNQGNIVGGSFNPGFVVTGKIDPIEKVIVDFSTIKKTIKSLIDDKLTGFDHKLWILEGYSKCKKEFKEDRVNIQSVSLRLDIPSNAVKVFNAKEYSLKEVEFAFEQYLNQKITELYPSVSIKCFNTINFQQLVPTQKKVSYFTYCHGLRNSTSWGCQNNSHGHLSFISLLSHQVDKQHVGNSEIFKLEQEIAKELDRTIFIWKDTLVQQKSDWIRIEYTTKERGLFCAEYHTQKNKLAFLETETTVEFLANYVCQKWRDELNSSGADILFLSEGLSKGGYVDLKSRVSA